MKRVPMMIVAFFIVLFVADGILLWVALTNQDEVVASYRTEHR
jgi:hypothetical protein